MEYMNSIGETPIVGSPKVMSPPDADQKAATGIQLSSLGSMHETHRRQLATMMDLSDIENVMDLFRLKERYCQPLSKEEQAVHREMAVKRQVQEVDAFVKLTDVRTIIKEGVTGLHKQLNTCEEVAKKANADCSNFQSRIKAVDRKVSEVA